jgi:hypothetical protein
MALNATGSALAAYCPDPSNPPDAKCCGYYTSIYWTIFDPIGSPPHGIGTNVAVNDMAQCMSIAKPYADAIAVSPGVGCGLPAVEVILDPVPPPLGSDVWDQTAIFYYPTPPLSYCTGPRGGSGIGISVHMWWHGTTPCTLSLTGPGGTDGALADVEPSVVESSKQIDGLRAETLCNGVPTPKDITLTLTAVDNSGGHQHVPGRPTGNLSVTGGTTPLTFAYTAPAVSGDYTITARCSDGTCNEATGFVWVGIKDLQSLQTDPSYVLITPNADQNHPSNHYVTGRTQEKIHGLATDYHELFPVDPLLYLNDASLIRGGVFDLAANWSSQPRGHSTHQRGTDIDVMANQFYHDPAKSIPSDNYVDLMNIVAPENGCNAQIHSGATPNEHFHLYCR